MMRPKPITSLPDPASFWSRVHVRGPDECWEWQGCRQKTGLPYGIVNTTDGNCAAHRIAYALAKGIPTPDEFVLHRCDNAPCCNPHHLFLGTHQENMQDRNTKARQAAGERHGSVLHPERLRRGEEHPMRLHPERLSRGSHRPASKLTEDQVREIRHRYAAGGVTQIALAREYGISPRVMNKIVHGEAWKHVV